MLLWKNFESSIWKKSGLYLKIDNFSTKYPMIKQQALSKRSFSVLFKKYYFGKIFPLIAPGFVFSASHFVALLYTKMTKKWCRALESLGFPMPSWNQARNEKTLLLISCHISENTWDQALSFWDNTLKICASNILLIQDMRWCIIFIPSVLFLSNRKLTNTFACLCAI